MPETPGQTNATSVLADIDATVDGRCACGCGEPLGPLARSGWFAEEACQVRWQRRRIGIVDNWPPTAEEVMRHLVTLNASASSPAPVRISWVSANGEPEPLVDLTAYVVPNSLTFIGRASCLSEPKPAPRPPWWRRALNRLTRKANP